MATLCPRRMPARNSFALEAPGTSVKVRATPASVCESLPPTTGLPNRRAKSPPDGSNALQHLPVDCFNSVKIACKNGEIVFRARPGEAGIEVIHGNEEVIFDRIGEQALDVMAAALQFDMVVFVGFHKRRRAFPYRSAWCR